MLCDICGKNQATVHLTEIIDEQMNELLRHNGSPFSFCVSTGLASGSTATLTGTTYTGGSMDMEGLLTLQGGTVTGTTVTNTGTIRNATGGLSQLGGTVTNTGTIAVSNNSGLQFTGGSTYTNDGQITLNAESTGVSDLRLAGTGTPATVTLQGSGSLAMSNATGNSIMADAANLTLVNGAAHTITGAGVIGGFGAPFTLQNEGTITADGSAGLVLAGGATVVNAGMIQATGGSPLTFYGGATNTGGTIQADGSTVTFLGPVPVTGGTLDVINGGTMALQSAVSDADLNIASGSTATLTGLTYSGGSMDVDGLLTLQGSMVTGTTVTNSGTIQNGTGGLSQLGGTVANTGTIAVSKNSGLQLTGGSTYTNDGHITLNSDATGVSDLRLAGSGTVGGVGFRTNSARVVVNFSDAPAHVPAGSGTARRYRGPSRRKRDRERF